MRILHLAKFYPPEFGGIEFVTESLSKGAASAGHNVNVVCFTARNSVDAYESNASVKIFRAPISIKVDSQPLSFKYMLYAFLFWFRSDIIHVHYPNILAAVLVLVFPFGKKIIVHWHSDVIGRSKVLTFLIRFIERCMLMRSSRVIATSQPYFEKSSSLSRFSEKVIVIQIGIPPVRDEEEECTKSEEIARFFGNKRIVLSVGRLVDYKGFNILIGAAKSFPGDTIVVIVGEGPLKNLLQEQINQEKLQSKVLLLGKISRHELNSLYKAASLFCLTSRNRAEAFGVVLLEALAHAVPVVATDIIGSGVGWVNLHGVSGFNAKPNDIESFSHFCNLILNSPALHETFSRNALKRFSSLFTEERAISGVLRLYSEVISDKGDSILV